MLLSYTKFHQNEHKVKARDYERRGCFVVLTFFFLVNAVVMGLTNGLGWFISLAAGAGLCAFATYRIGRNR